jgi:branched-chain amino acid aminotransferase
LKTTFASPNEVNKKPPVNELGFGKHFTDHMLTIKWTPEKGWEDPQIGPLVPFQMHPASKVLSRYKFFYLTLLNDEVFK